LRGFFNGEVGSLQQGPRAGQEAPDFELSTPAGDKTVRLHELKGEKPIVLVFGNFTCGPFRRTYPDFDEICERYRDRAHFVGVYVREAHPSDGWLMESNTRLGVKLPQPKSIEERTSVAKRCATELKYSMPLLVDTMDDRVGNLYSGMPARAYVIGKDGIVTYQGGRGPFGFRPAEMEQSLILTLMQ
jgi:thiol-disulfide isomerase/thioredoxin